MLKGKSAWCSCVPLAIEIFSHWFGSTCKLTNGVSYNTVRKLNEISSAPAGSDKFRKLVFRTWLSKLYPQWPSCFVILWPAQCKGPSDILISSLFCVPLLFLILVPRVIIADDMFSAWAPPLLQTEFAISGNRVTHFLKTVVKKLSLNFTFLGYEASNRNQTDALTF